MSKIKKSLKIIKQQGLKNFGQEICKYTLLESPISSFLKTILGEKTNHEFYNYFNLGYWPNIKTPETFNEKLLHRKLYTNNKLFSIVEDKFNARSYVNRKLENDILPDLYHVTEDPETIPFQELPDEYVIKPTHLSGPVIILDKDTDLEEKEIKDKCSDWLKINHGKKNKEYWYEQIKPRIIVEERLKTEDSYVPLDFKFFAFHNKVEYIQVDFDRYDNHRRTIFDKNWIAQNFKIKYPKGPKIQKPSNLEEMIEIAEKLSADFNFIRVDLYSLNNERIVFGELTVCPESGAAKIRPLKYDYKLGDLWRK
ncbi:ATP-grasp fold amidoligase family protein [Methanonatronarchaeum sp. AMET-Sl]|uniref:ATP-grasp fold amidoligase family protein n=1 Tax=Methanonatronarchaeum sp. AMET-Sl TaxID=3037654 RepID=UPI00244E37E8|nr:ATP-grasp fold amidoligase family protein [Methanonatronarchaeum sp. AMET-Sl]WGI17638.1 ATP-grasp fold amidoligase family protein [Methanonatronarchaeum sp. AMET-Sl]